MPWPRPFSFQLSFGALCGALALWAIALRVLLIPIPPHDFWWHMAQGRGIAASGRVPTLDAFSYTQGGAPFFDQSWLAQWLFFLQHQIGGVPLLIFTQAALVTASYFALWTMAQARAREALQVLEEGQANEASERAARVAALVLLGVTVVSFDNWLLRPQTYAIPLFVAWLWTLEAWRRASLRPAALLALQVALMAAWVNTHGSFPLALLLNTATLLGAWAGSKSHEDANSARASLGVLAAVSVASAVAIVLNPRGLEVLGYVRMMLGHPSNRFSAEWLSPTPRNAGDAIFFAFALLTFLVLAHVRRRPLWLDSARLALFFWLAITSGRYILWFALVAALPLAQAIAPSFSGASSSTSSGSRRMNALVALVMWLALAPLLPWAKPSLGLPPPLGLLVSDETPVRAAQVLEAAAPRRPWHNAPTGSYLTWATPKLKVWIDTRFELFPPEQWRAHARAASGDASVLDRYKCDAALLDLRSESALDRQLRRRGWTPLLRDARWAVWRR